MTNPSLFKWSKHILEKFGLRIFQIWTQHLRIILSPNILESFTPKHNFAILTLPICHVLSVVGSHLPIQCSYLHIYIFLLTFNNFSIFELFLVSRPLKHDWPHILHIARTSSQSRASQHFHFCSSSSSVWTFPRCYCWWKAEYRIDEVWRARSLWSGQGSTFNLRISRNSEWTFSSLGLRPCYFL